MKKNEPGNPMSLSSAPIGPRESTTTSTSVTGLSEDQKTYISGKVKTYTEAMLKGLNLIKDGKTDEGLKMISNQIVYLLGSYKDPSDPSGYEGLLSPSETFASLRQKLATFEKDAITLVSENPDVSTIELANGKSLKELTREELYNQIDRAKTFQNNLEESRNSLKEASPEKQKEIQDKIDGIENLIKNVKVRVLQEITSKLTPEEAAKKAESVSLDNLTPILDYKVKNDLIAACKERFPNAKLNSKLSKAEIIDQVAVLLKNETAKNVQFQLNKLDTSFFGKDGILSDVKKISTNDDAKEIGKLMPILSDQEIASLRDEMSLSLKYIRDFIGESNKRFTDGDPVGSTEKTRKDKLIDSIIGPNNKNDQGSLGRILNYNSQPDSIKVIIDKARAALVNIKMNPVNSLDDLTKPNGVYTLFGNALAMLKLLPNIDNAKILDIQNHIY